ESGDQVDPPAQQRFDDGVDGRGQGGGVGEQRGDDLEDHTGMRIVGDFTDVPVDQRLHVSGHGWTAFSVWWGWVVPVAGCGPVPRTAVRGGPQASSLPPPKSGRSSGGVVSSGSRGEMISPTPPLTMRMRVPGEISSSTSSSWTSTTVA